MGMGRGRGCWFWNGWLLRGEGRACLLLQIYAVTVKAVAARSRPLYEFDHFLSVCVLLQESEGY